MIFCDMDGVLVDFDGYFKKKYGIFPFEISKQDLWETVLQTKDYWLNLPKTADADILVNFLNQTGYTILTGLPSYGFDKAEKEKKAWLKKHYNKEHNIICCLSKDKPNYGCAKDILIDDRKNNIQNWQKMGGIGILHKSANETIKQLKQHIDNKKTLSI